MGTSSNDAQSSHLLPTHPRHLPHATPSFCPKPNRGSAFPRPSLTTHALLPGHDLTPPLSTMATGSHPTPTAHLTPLHSLTHSLTHYTTTMLVLALLQARALSPSASDIRCRTQLIVQNSEDPMGLTPFNFGISVEHILVSCLFVD